MPTPEERARQQIDALLTQCRWGIQDYRKLDLSAARGIAIREVRLTQGRCDYLLLIDRKPVGIIEAKKAGVTLSSVADQSGRYAENLPDFLRGNLSGKLPFLYESTGIETFFRDERDPHPRSRRVFAFHRPETLAKWLEEPDTLRHRLAQMPFAHPYNGENVRVCRVEAITNLEQSFAEAQPRALIQMATGAGKTLTACAFTYRLIKHAGARNVLFLIDRANLGRQAMAAVTRNVAEGEAGLSNAKQRPGLHWSSSDKTSSEGEARRVSAGSANQFQQFVIPDGRKFTSSSTADPPRKSRGQRSSGSTICGRTCISP